MTTRGRRRRGRGAAAARSGYGQIIHRGGPGSRHGAVRDRCGPTLREVIAVDISPVMLSRLGAKIARSGDDNVQCVLRGFPTYQHGRASRFRLQPLCVAPPPDFWKSIALARIHDRLGPRGVFRPWDVVDPFTVNEAPDRIEWWCATLEADGAGWIRAELEEHVRDEHSTYSWLLEPMIEQVGFAIADRSYTADGMFASYVLRRR